MAEKLNPLDYTRLATAVAMGGDPEGGLDMTVGMIRRSAGAEIPDLSPARAALTAWGIPHTEGGGIPQMFSTTPSLAVTLPPGWSVSRRGGGGHVELLDAAGASRMRWHIHGWDPICLNVNHRYSVRLVNLSAAEAVLQVLDGTVVIHTVPVVYPHARINDPHSDGTPYYRNGYPKENAGWTNAMIRANYAIEQDAYDAGKRWLDDNRPHHEDALASWGTP